MVNNFLQKGILINFLDIIFIKSLGSNPLYIPSLILKTDLDAMVFNYEVILQVDQIWHSLNHSQGDVAVTAC